MSEKSGWQVLESRFANALPMQRRPVAVAFIDTPPAGVDRFEGSEPLGCSFWRLAADGKTFTPCPKNHFNCAVGAYTHNITLSPDREPETGLTLKMMFDLGYVRPRKCRRFRACRSSRRPWCIRRLGTLLYNRTPCCSPASLEWPCY